MEQGARRSTALGRAIAGGRLPASLLAMSGDEACSSCWRCGVGRRRRAVPGAATNLAAFGVAGGFGMPGPQES